MTPIEKFVEMALSQEGDDYIFGAEASPSDDNPDAFDCSELVQWSAARVAMDPTVPDGSWYQARHCRNYGLLTTVTAAINTRGALLFKFDGDPFTGGRPSSAHVAISLGDGTTIEARSSRYGVGSFTAIGRGWTHGGLIPGANYDAVQNMYRGVLNVPDDQWARDVVDRGIASGMIVTSDDFPDDWERTDYSDGRLWTFIDRLS